MHLTVFNFCLVAVGVVIHILFKLSKIQRKHPDDFNLRIYIRHNWIQLILSLMCGFVVMYFADNISEGVLDLHVHHDSNYYQVYAVVAGYNNQQLFDQYMRKNK